jgi:hypothetical protein
LTSESSELQALTIYIEPSYRRAATALPLIARLAPLDATAANITRAEFQPLRAIFTPRHGSASISPTMRRHAIYCARDTTADAAQQFPPMPHTTAY